MRKILNLYISFCKCLYNIPLFDKSSYFKGTSMQMNKVTRFREQGYFFVIERQICNTNTCKKIVITCNFVSKHRMRSQMQRLDQFGSVFTAVMGLSKYIKNPRLTYIFHKFRLLRFLNRVLFSEEKNTLQLRALVVFSLFLI